MRGSEIDIVHHKAKRVVRSYRTRGAKNISPDHIVHGLRWWGRKRKETRQSDVSAWVCSPIVTVPSLSEHLHFLHSCSSDELVWLVSVLNLAERLPQAFLDGLAEEDRTTCYHVTLLCYCVTLSVQIPCEMQLRVVLAKQHKKDSLVSAGTGSSKTLPTILNALLDTPDQWLVTLVISPLKQLQVTQESDFNIKYGIPVVVINEDTPREDAWWTVGYNFSHCDNLISLSRRISGTIRSDHWGPHGFWL